MSTITALLVAFAALLGLIIGSFLNVVIYRVPVGIPLTRPSQCPHCDSPVKPWQNVPVVSWLLLRGKCANCGAPISVRYPLVELATGVAFAGVVWMLVESEAFRLASLAQRPEAGAEVGALAFAFIAVAYLYLAAISIALTMIDLDMRRLPNPIVLPSYIALAVLFTAACLAGAPWDALLRAAIGGAALFAFYWLLRFAKPGGMGGGDVKLAGVLGAALGFVGWGALIVGAFAAFLIGGVVGIVMMLTRRATRKTAIPFGPFMVVGAWLGIVIGEPIARWYTGLLGLA
ncbi:prepilin peptidase [Microbacterium telephonicum]|uniref:Leader peptidase (Prepilin peptidase)/N-methyltransferase n=1 Tax=Microbacterium telephonicum TaxID=1714841 RepID=A0A498C455_9MICO|nr:A24 family peptidase [Microbacterium telephonicum]RLK49697.1 leader peptidase (prepilin peptidase)/N-methyltransferase [Microbacterium telephonicum]